MARPVWKGSIAFGLVSIPVGLHGAVQDQRVRFHQLERGTSNRIRYRRVNEETGEEVPLERIVRGVPVDDGRIVVLDDDDLAAAAPEQSRTIDLQDFVDGEQIDPVLYDTPYYLAPATTAARRPYALLAAALERSGRVGIATFVLREREHLAAIRSRDGVLVLETLRFADEVREPPVELRDIDGVAASGRELDIALSLVESMQADFDPARYHDTYRERLEALVEAKARGETLEVHPAAPAAASNVVDLVSVLSRSVDEARRRRLADDDAGGVTAGGRPAGADDDGAAGAARGTSARSSAAGPKAASPKVASPGVADSGATGSADAGAGAPPDLAGLRRDDLYRLAQELDVPGRSSMGRAALLEAVVAARRQAPAPARRRAS